MTYPQPHEGITGIDRNDDLLSLDMHAVAHRYALIAMARHLSTATLVGDPAPVVRAMGDRIRRPEPGDLVVETSRVIYGQTDLDTQIKGFGIFLARRLEWSSTDAQWAGECAEEGWNPVTEERMTDTAIYIQYGSAAAAICRWENAEVITLPIQISDFSAPVGTRDGRGVTFTRNDLVGGLADSGFKLRLP
jgi:hypothetical protein